MVTRFGGRYLCCLKCGEGKTVLEYDHCSPSSELIITNFPQVGGHARPWQKHVLWYHLLAIFHRAMNSPFKWIPELNTYAGGIDTGVYQYGLVLAIGGFLSCFQVTGVSWMAQGPPEWLEVWAGCCHRETEMFSNLSLALLLLARGVNMRELLRLS